MVLEARIGFLRDRLLVDGQEVQIRREKCGWTRVSGDAAAGGGRVRYEGLRDRLRIESPGGNLQIQFRWRHTTFSWKGRRYRIGPMVWGHVSILEGDRPVATGRLTLSGVRLGYVSPELVPVSRELAVGLARRAVAMWAAAGAAGASG